jgi:hypothetical protein
MPRTSLARFVPLLLATSLAAQITTASVQLGGPGALGSQGGDPPVLSDSSTVATGTLDFTYDSSTGQLIVVVTNTTVDVPGNPNPLMSEIFFNAPQGAVTGMTLQSQVGGPNGAPPAFDFVFDADLANAPDPNGADGLGHYSVGLYKPNGPVTGVANANAAFWVQPLSQIYEGPVTFTFLCTGPSTASITAQTFASALSWIPPGNSTCQGAAHFQAGGANGAFSAFIGTTHDCVVQSAQPGCHGCMVAGFNPGPFQVGDLIVPFGPPWIVLQSQTMAFSTASLSITVPNNPIYAGMTLLFGSLTYGYPIVAPSFSQVATITICQ